MTADAHPAFPSTGASSARAKLPTYEQISQWISPTSPLKGMTRKGIQREIIPPLERLVNGPDQEQAEIALLQKDTKLEFSSEEDVAVMSVPLLYILNTRLVVANRDGKADMDLLSQCVEIGRKMDGSQLYTILPGVSQLAWSLLQLARKCQAVEGILDVMYTLCTFAPQHHLTGAHVAYLEACLLVKIFTGAAVIVQNVYTDIALGRLTYLDIITFYHHAGLVAAACSSYDIAKEMFSIAVSVPTHEVSAIQVAAAKRAILCELLDTGTYIKFPISTSSKVTRAIERNAFGYQTLAKLFAKQTWDEVQKALESSKQIFEQDCNTGLIRRVQDAVLQRNILQVRELYSRLTVEQLAAKVAGSQPMTTDEVLIALQNLVASGKIQATIEGEPGVITFHDNATSPKDNLDRLANLNGLTSILDSHLGGYSLRLGMDERYLQKQASILDARPDNDYERMLRSGGPPGDMVVDVSGIDSE